MFFGNVLFPCCYGVSAPWEEVVRAQGTAGDRS